MWRRFTSSFFNKVDAKGRVSVPAAWRKTLEARGADGNLILVPGFRDRRCIEGYAPDTYETLAAAISSMHPSDPKRRKLEYRLMGRAVPLQVDENGRIILRLEVAPEDKGKVIGRHGRVAESIRVLLRVAAVKQDVRATLEII